ncbi:cation diffusion facilitator family transporter [Polyangium jinanense]|uniref:Cation diffusion facilitator family transporter n=1 Tax=Polyangium jinanense TaxID=2829994 RepID=A0A9X4AWP4_9BACT|nr:cation diffusion facilitator family transporter [Polyangium jinanense]MDC3957045.1 cation diffusion facilitator family transporter [Polyangium jinanense]MDC3987081.1 cation diffusion facilitator family transporter [Polyangium jinanense]
MATPSSLPAVIAALAANTLVTLLKFVAFFLSGSGAMLSEAIHSAADTGNQLLLFIGLKRGARQGDEEFPYGYGGERFVFGLLSAAGIFFVGCGVTVYHGIEGLRHPHATSVNVVTFVVLGLSFLIEGSALVFAARSIAAQRGSMPFFRYVREKADPASVAILLEDGAAVLGLFLAAIGIVASYYTGSPVWDAIASILVGLLLGFVAIHLVTQNRELLIGMAVPDGVEEAFVRVLRERPSVRGVRDVKSRRITPEVYKLKAEVTFDAAFLAARLDLTLPAQPGALSGAERERTLRVVADGALLAISKEIDDIEVAVRAVIPEARHIDIEVDHHIEDRLADSIRERASLRATSAEMSS